MVRRARLLLALIALSTLCAAPAVLADEETTTTNVVTQVVEWLTGLFGGENLEGDEYNPVFLPGG